MRGHKANDQVLAKRVKRLLRKWKENLEASTGGGVVVNGGVTAVTNSNVINSNNSRPISPENCSQQSNDVQFISSHTPQVIPINGNTNNFTNFLQNQHTVPMRSSHEQQTMVLGKRNNKQAELDDHDVDENSNHSRRKKIKETSVVVTIPSPPSLQQKPLTINQNNSISNKNHMTLPPPPPTPTPTVPAQLHLPPSSVESPKKRGRKKGSKGIDSTLFEASKFLNSTPNFKSTIDVDIKQKIASSATKKNKTTKELLADLQKRCKDEMSEDSNHYGMLHGSPDAIIPEWDNSSSNTMDHKFSSHLEPSLLDSTQSGISKKPLFKNIEEEIQYLRAQLTPIDYEAAANDIYDDLNALDEDGEVVPCTCTFHEKEEEVKIEENVVTAKDAVVVVKKELNGIIMMPDENEIKIMDSDDDDDDDFCAVEPLLPILALPKAPVKSIFDLDADSDDDSVLNSLERIKNDAQSRSQVISVKIDVDRKKLKSPPPRMEVSTEQSQFDLLNPELHQPPPIVTYICDEDPDCPAKSHLERATQFDDTNALHDTFLDGLNGNWNGLAVDTAENDIVNPFDLKYKCEKIDYDKHELWKRVVPYHNHLIMDKIPKPSTTVNLVYRPSVSSSTINSNCNRVDSDNREFREWHEVMNVKSYNEDILTILPYVVID